MGFSRCGGLYASGALAPRGLKARYHIALANGTDKIQAPSDPVFRVHPITRAIFTWVGGIAMFDASDLTSGSIFPDPLAHKGKHPLTCIKRFPYILY